MILMSHEKAASRNPSVVLRFRHPLFNFACRTTSARFNPVMNMPRIIFIFAAIFILLGIGAYLGTGTQSWTALIPAIFGLLLALAGGFALISLKHGGHIAALLGVLGFLGTVRGLITLPALFAGAPVERPEAVVTQAIMAVLCVAFVALCVKSFIDARRGKKAW